MPKNRFLLDLMAKVGPLASSSANISGQEPIKNIYQAKKIFADREYELVLVNPEKFKLSSIPSTIVDLDKMTVLRQGAVNGQKVIDSIKRSQS